MGPLYKEVEWISHEELTRRHGSRNFSSTPARGEAADLALSYIAHMERNRQITIDSQTGQLLQDLDLAKWKRLADDFSRWIAEGELSSPNEMIDEELYKSGSELFQAQVRALMMMTGMSAPDRLRSPFRSPDHVRSGNVRSGQEAAKDDDTTTVKPVTHVMHYLGMGVNKTYSQYSQPHPFTVLSNVIGYIAIAFETEVIRGRWC